MKRSMLALSVIATATLLSSCNNDGDIENLEQQVNDLNQQLEEIKSEKPSEDLDQQITDLEEQLAKLQPNYPALGSSLPVKANTLASASDATVWRFAVIPDTQGRDDDNMKTYVNVDRDGNVLDVSEWIGVDYNRDGYYDGGTESQKDSVKADKPAEDGISYLVNVQDPFQPFIETDDSGQPIVVAPEDRKDFGPDWKILPLPLVDAVADKIKQLDVDLVLATGDITEYRAESDYVQWMDHVAKPLTEAGISIFPVRGNHEVVNGRNWPAWFTAEQEWERQSVNNVYNDINAYQGFTQLSFDQGYRLYNAYAGQLVNDHINSGKVTGFPGAENLVYSFVHENTLFIAIDYYFAELYSSAYQGTWIELRDWLVEQITTQGPNVNHIVAYGHEPLSTKKRPQTYQVDIYENYISQQQKLKGALEQLQQELTAAIAVDSQSAAVVELTEKVEVAQAELDELTEPSLNGYDIGQLGYLQLQDDSQPGLAEEILTLFTEYQVTYIAGHDHQYARSLIHSSADKKDSADGFTQIIGGNASWKAYENYYGMQDEFETGLYINNFNSNASGNDLVNSEGLKYASETSGLGEGISFVLVEFDGRKITTSAYYADHDLTEVDMNLGAHYDANEKAWCTYSGDFLVKGAETVKTCNQVEWQILDKTSRTTDATAKVVAPEENYFLTSKTPDNEGYIGSQASIVDGYNLTYDSSYAQTVDRLERMRELLSLSWFADENPVTVSDVLLISGNQTQDGSYFDSYGKVQAPVISTAGATLAQGKSPSLTYVNQRGASVNNPTHSTADGKTIKGVDLNASLNPELLDGNPGGDSANWNERYLADNLDFADAMTLVFKAPQNAALTDLTVARFNEQSEVWEPVFSPDCYIESGYSDHYSVYYRISEQHPEGGKEISNCQQRYWGYVEDSHTVWGFIHTDGQFALINK